LTSFVLTPLTSQATQQKKTPNRQPIKELIWSDPGPVERLDFSGGSGGRKNTPKPPFTFIEESLSGTTSKVRVSDANGVKWTVKFGSEVNAETFATRIAWAAGYFVEPNYFVPSGKVEKLGALKRAEKYFESDGRFTEARFYIKQPKAIKKIDDENSWSWNQTPFVGTKEFNGLKVIVMLTSNWDNKDVRDTKRGSNTAIFQVPTRRGLENRYLVTDWGGSMGKWGNFFTREKWDCKGFRSQTEDFIKGVKNDIVEFGYSGQHTDSFKNDIRVNDLKWLLRYVGRITDGQLRAGLQASGATTDEVECFRQSLRERINQMKEVVRQAPYEDIKSHRGRPQMRRGEVSQLRSYSHRSTLEE
jgi:hypothetical protein